MKATLAILSALFVSFVATTMAFAATGTTPEDPSELARPILDAISGGQWFAAAAFALVAAATLARQHGSTRFPFLATKAGAALLVLVGSFGAALGAALTAAGTNAVTWALMLTAGKFAMAAAGGYALIDALVVDPLMKSTWYQTKAPAWFKAVANVALWAFKKPPAVVKAKAEAAGAEAVKANPGTGHGTFSDV